MKLKIFFILVFLIVSKIFFGQALQLTQFYNSPTLLSPAFAGLGSCSRASTNYRVQWPEISGAFSTMVFAFDHQLVKKRTGLGILFTNDKAGSGNLRSTSFAAQYSHQFLLSHGWIMNAGAEAGYVIRNYDYSKLVFGDMIAYGTSTSVEQPNATRIHYFDFSSGALFYDRKNWVGISGRHLNMPNQELISSGASRLPILYSVHTGTKISVGKKIDKRENNPKECIIPAINFRYEKNFNQLDIGFYYQNLPLVLGMWYRGLPVFKSYKAGYQNNDAIALLAGVEIDRFKFGYSYDITISRIWKNTGGSHEISLAYQFCKQQGKKVMACPKF